MLTVDFHTHTFFSQCGIHTHIEMLTRAKELGLQAMAITDHGPALKSRDQHIIFKRASSDMVSGIKFLKGMECNILDDKGNIDLPMNLLPYIDIVLLGLHPNIPSNKGMDYYTSIMLKAIDKYPMIDVITHPNQNSYPLNFEVLAQHAQKKGIALELNNSKTMLGLVDNTITIKLINAIKNANCNMVISSDAHAINEIGLDSSVMPLIRQCNFPIEYIVNRTLKSSLDFIDNRKKNKTRL